MAFAVVLNFDVSTEMTIREAWQRLAERGVSTNMLDYEVRPHVTLSAAEGMDEATFRPWLRHFVVQIRPIDLLFQAIGVFPTQEGVVYYAPAVTQKLLDIHEGFHRAVPDSWQEVHPYYRPERWVPHCTAALGLKREQILEAVSICMEIPLPLAGQCTQMTLIETQADRPVRAIEVLNFGDSTQAVAP